MGTHREGPADHWVEQYWDEETGKGTWESVDPREGGWCNQEGLCLHPRQAGCTPHPAGALCEFCVSSARDCSVRAHWQGQASASGERAGLKCIPTCPFSVESDIPGEKASQTWGKGHVEGYWEGHFPWDKDMDTDGEEDVH